jgi:hypothetical protein
VNVAVRRSANGEMELRQEPLPEMPAELQHLFEEAH